MKAATYVMTEIKERKVFNGDNEHSLRSGHTYKDVNSNVSFSTFF